MNKLIFFIFSVSFLSCNLQGKEDFLDNPTAETITFQLNGKSYTLNGFSSEKVKLKLGKHSLKTPNGQLVEFEKKSNNRSSIINPTGSEYVIYARLFVFSKEELSYKALHGRYKEWYQTIVLEQKKYFAPAIVTTDYYIDESVYKWNYGLNDDFDEIFSNQKLEELQKKVAFSELLKTKIFRADEFLKRYGNQFHELE